MVVWEPWHRLEYQRVGVGHVYTECVEDNGWKLIVKGVSRDDWFVQYTRTCAEDFLARRRAPNGEYIVAVYRTGATRSGAPLPLGSIRFRWRATSPPRASVSNA